MLSKSFKLGFNNSTWTENFQMFKLDLEKAEEPEIKLPTSIGSQRKQGNSRKTSPSALLTTLKPLTLDHNKQCKILKEMGIPDHFYCLLRNPYSSEEATVRPGLEQWTGSKLERSTSKLYIVTLLFNLYAKYIMQNAGPDASQAEIKITGRNINNLRCICRWYHFNGRK